MDTDAIPPATAAEAPEQPRHVCCVCGEPLTPPYHVMGGRAYCDRHFALVNKPHMGFWRSALVQVLGIALFSGAVALVAPYVEPLENPWRVVAGVVLVFVPVAFWLFYFYLQDRLEPEPKTKIGEVFLLAVLLTEAAGYPLVNNIFQVPSWASSLNIASLLASILIVGFTWQAITYIAVRAVVYTTSEFDERMDGIVYGTMAGLGVATVLNLHYVLGNGGVALGPGVVHIVTSVLAQASFGGVLGYFMAQAKFEQRPAWWVPAGLVLAAVLNGFFVWLIDEVSADGLDVAPWRSLVLAIVVALFAFTALLLLMRQANRATLSPPVGNT